MLSHFIYISFRGFWRRKSFTFINILGLTVGVTSCLLISIFVLHELSFDKFNKHADRIVRLIQSQSDGTRQRLAVTPGPAGPLIARSLPEIEKSVRAVSQEKTVEHGDHFFLDQQMLVVDSSFFDVFTVPMIGGGHHALTAPYSIVLSETASRRYFGTANSIGETLTLYRGSRPEEFSVTGVIRDMPSTSHLQFEGLLSLATEDSFNPVLLDRWSASMFATYLLLKPESDRELVETKVDALLNDHAGFRERGSVDYTFQPLTDIYLRSDLVGHIGERGNRVMVYLLAAIALLILVIASINFINLSTARASERSREVGVRKAVGASRRELVLQFLIESTLLATVSVSAGLCLAWLLARPFKSFAGVGELYGTQSEVIVLLVGVATFSIVIVGLVAGYYPAVILSRYEPSRVLKGRGSPTGSSLRFRQALVILQLTSCIALIAGAATVYEQLEFVRSEDLGFNAANLIAVDVPGAGHNAARILPIWENLPVVREVTADSRSPDFWAKTRVRSPRDPYQDRITINFFDVAHDFVDVLGINVIAGRDFREGMASDYLGGVVINRTASRMLGWVNPAEAIGRRILRNYDEELRILGVVEDFHYESLHEEIGPLLLLPRTTEFRRILVRIGEGEGEAAHVLPSLRSTWDQVFPDLPFSHRFVAESLDAQYAGEEKAASVITFFAILAMMVACIGLFGLASFAVKKRAKEISIRKVLGASSADVVRLLSGEYAKLFLISMMLAAPMSILALELWLQGYAYRTTIGLATFVVAGGVTFVVAQISVAYHTISAASMNPVPALKEG